MLIASWNVNGLRACMKTGCFASGYGAIRPDALCLQEIRLSDIDAAEESLRGVDLPPYRYWHPSSARKGYSGTAVFSRIEPVSASRGFAGSADAPPDDEGRVLTLEYPSFYLVNVYSPNAQDGLKRIDYRLAWEDALRGYVNRLDQTKPVVICGDLNVAHNEIDLARPSANRGNKGFSDEERGKLTELLSSGFADSYRRAHPHEKGAYTWWSHMANARARNIGWRLDYFLVSERLWRGVANALIYPEIVGSDHCPVGIELNIG
ncbi:MAG: exodeoxyribonuclease III [Oscillospiraceae bacterium]|jgi:exodeoxyribonuclease-3|nr:exodeoxyribonuclease III [Oscillospiraceae bacterium]